jgi:hypothetical protein
MIRSALFSIIVFFGAAIGAPASAQVQNAAFELKAAKSLWLRRDYSNAYAALLTLRAKPYGRRVEVDFMLATSACQLGYRPYALKVLTNIMSRYSLGARAQRGVQQQIINCAPQNATIVIIEPSVPTTSGGWGKTFFWLDKQLPVTSYPARRTREIDPAVLAARLVRRGAPVPTELFQSEGCSPTIGEFVLLCNSSIGIDAERQIEIVAEADAFVRFLNERYGIRPADEYVTIRLVPNVGQVSLAADRLHGLDVSSATIAYSFQDDLSLVAVSSGKSGSILHELVHLALRRDFGDAPQWIEEGMASLYEVSLRCDGKFVGLDNWRGDLLRRGIWPTKPGALEVIDQKWFELVQQAHGTEEAPVTPSMGFEYERAVAEAKMRYITFYLQEQDKLALVYGGLKAAPADADVADHQASVLSRAMGNKYTDLEDTLEYFTSLKKTEAPRNLSDTCRQTGSMIRKEIPEPPTPEIP